MAAILFATKGSWIPAFAGMTREKEYAMVSKPVLKASTARA
jgi:hypothetical protein